MVGLATGVRSGFFIVDLDPKQKKQARLGELTPDGLAAWARLTAEHGHTPTYEVTTPSGGRHMTRRAPSPTGKENLPAFGLIFAGMVVMRSARRPAA
jgi:hypothetical protein